MSARTAIPTGRALLLVTLAAEEMGTREKELVEGDKLVCPGQRLTRRVLLAKHCADRSLIPTRA